ncbi:septum formation inhibitor Maf [Ichthyenterobacterium sp. W332]|uniref:Septum formation inhibitor Maf n=1 Tax=Microcosmobacter mediterraneus TaxID=3075607 RepID=A0ABU2YHH0_9FLAO|nr:septum formation inhibitor Maf [Ichthyenterobacterium sp. W332]MDT0557615.1 septum formation inhibitor Maf [Ichthyenterobacterium sp. W332]
MKLFLSLVFILSLLSCKEERTDALYMSVNNETNSAKTKPKENASLSEAFKAYWYAGEAEITSYRLKQARYGESRDGFATLVYVTEPFEKDLQVKADYANASNIPVLKLNTTKNFNTGIYPYSIMQSTFYPVDNHNHALKVSCSVQEWCGHVYAQLNNRDDFEFTSHSYFQSEADQDLKLEKAILENELWTQLRINPSSLPTGQFKAIPSLEFIRLKHIPAKAYTANARLGDGVYEISYPEINRSLTINFNNSFPYEILGWEESYMSGFGANAKTMTSSATRLKTIKSAYWSKNSVADEHLRDSLGLR